MKIVIIGAIIFISGFIAGMLVYRYNVFPVKHLKKLKNYIFQKYIPPQLPDNVYLIPFTKGTRLFSDRNYNDLVGDSTLESTYVLQIPRHLKSPIEIEILRPVKIYRLLTEENNNSVFKGWELTSIKVNVQGRSCTFTDVVSKSFKPGKIIMPCGGPKAASPIIIRDLSQSPVNFPVKIMNMRMELKN